MPNVTAKIFSIGPTLPIPSKDGSKMYHKRYVALDMTYVDPQTGQRSPRANTPEFEFFGDAACDAIDRLAVGQEVNVTYAIEGHQYTKKATGELAIITTLKGSSIEPVAVQQAYTAVAPTPRHAARPAPSYAQGELYAGQPMEVANDLPF